MFAGLIAKVAQSAVGGFLQSYGVWILGGILVAFVSWYVWSAERAKEKVVTLKIEISVLIQEKKDLLETIDANKLALDECIEANAQNALQAVREAQRVRAAQADVAAMRREMNEHINLDRTAVENMRGTDTECRTLDQPLPAWVADRLRDEP